MSCLLVISVTSSWWVAPQKASNVTPISLPLASKLFQATAAAVPFHSWRYFKPEESGRRGGGQRKSRDGISTSRCNGLEGSPVIHSRQTKHTGGDTELGLQAYSHQMAMLPVPVLKPVGQSFLASVFPLKSEGQDKWERVLQLQGLPLWMFPSLCPSTRSPGVPRSTCTCLVLHMSGYCRIIVHPSGPIKSGN